MSKCTKYRISEQVDNTGDSTFYPQYKRDKYWMYYREDKERIGKTSLKKAEKHIKENLQNTETNVERIHRFNPFV